MRHARQRHDESNLRLVVKISRRYNNRGLAYRSDRRRNLGLIAVEKLILKKASVFQHMRLGGSVKRLNVPS